MVNAELYGGLGNRMFQQAAAIGYAEEHKDKFHLNYTNVTLPTIRVDETGHNYNHIPRIGTGRENVNLNGYFQSEKYFKHAEAKVREYFNAPTEYSAGICSIHVRRGDYLHYPSKHPVVTVDYLYKAIDFILSNTSTHHFDIFSDDPKWCSDMIPGIIKKVQKEIDENMEFTTVVSHEINRRSIYAGTDMFKMAQCEHNIIANSTFSWWGAWLNPNTDKIVVSPSASNWFGPGNSHLDTSDIIPESWHQIKY